MKVLDKYEARLFFSGDVERYVLEINCQPKHFFQEIKCDTCIKSINQDDLIYFCGKDKTFFHKDCLKKGNHHKKHSTFKNQEHEDHWVILQFKGEKK